MVLESTFSGTWHRSQQGGSFTTRDNLRSNFQPSVAATEKGGAGDRGQNLRDQRGGTRETQDGLGTTPRCEQHQEHNSTSKEREQQITGSQNAVKSGKKSGHGQRYVGYAQLGPLWESSRAVQPAHSRLEVGKTTTEASYRFTPPTGRKISGRSK